MSTRKAVAPPWATDEPYSSSANPIDTSIKVTSRRFTSNVPLPSGAPSDFQTWGTGAHENESSWSLRNRPLPEIYGGLDKSRASQNLERMNASNPNLFRKKTPSLDANPYEGVLGRFNLRSAGSPLDLTLLVSFRAVDV